ncbi:ImmA/IrrE family metallo-endopeptidase [Deinococcus cellulosilyticus]|uniref:ImmA/IrrE family metallo-endopeptidase n=1 Tax=Deinococcus cellulosilyticus TaxID=401558 RepID=UPI001649A2AC|nr:ImmA/IrrE family metallo-endopeptidase [Deinococcus cellulosilyticus]
MLRQEKLLVQSLATRESLEQARDILGLDINVLIQALPKIHGMYPEGTDVVFVNLNSLPERQRFVKLHELAHKVLPWQIFSHLETDDVLRGETRENFEIEANMFAAELLFQGARFQNQALLEPLDIRSALKLAQRFGASAQASLQRYVHTHEAPCALVVLNEERTSTVRGPAHTVRQVITSQAFPECTPWWKPGDLLPSEHPLIRHFKRSALTANIPEYITFDTPSGICRCNLQMFRNSYRMMVFLAPQRAQPRRQNSTRSQVQRL